MDNHHQSDRRLQWVRSFATLDWYEETIRFIFNFVAKTSELLLAAGIIVSTANFLTDGDIMSHNKSLSDAWSWAQALAIDSSLGIVFMNAFVAVREREKIKAAVYITLTVLLATVAGLITHFDAYSHASGLPVTDKSVSGVIPLWIMTALRAVAVIGFLLASRLKNISFNELRRELAHEPQPEPTVPQIDYNALATALIGAMQQAGTIGRMSSTEEEDNHYQRPKLTPLPETRTDEQPEQELTIGSRRRNRNRTARTGNNHHQEWEPINGNQPADKREPNGIVEGTNTWEPIPNGSQHMGTGSYHEREPTIGKQRVRTDDFPELERTTIRTGTADEKLRNAYEAIKVEGNRITGKALSNRAGVRKQTALEWLQKQQGHGAEREEQAKQS